MQLMAALQTESISLQSVKASQQLNAQVKQLKSAAEYPDIYLKPTAINCMQLMAGLQTEGISLRLAEAGQQLNTQTKQLKIYS